MSVKSRYDEWLIPTPIAAIVLLSMFCCCGLNVCSETSASNEEANKIRSIERNVPSRNQPARFDFDTKRMFEILDDTDSHFARIESLLSDWKTSPHNLNEASFLIKEAEHYLSCYNKSYDWVDLSDRTTIRPKFDWYCDGRIIEAQERNQSLKSKLAELTLDSQRINSLQKWQYYSGHDEMTSKFYKRAAQTSENLVSFRFPYGKNQRGNLVLREHPRYGFDAIIDFDSAQIKCRYDGCSIKVRFDDQPLVRWNVSKPSDGSSDIVFLRNSKGFLERLKTSKKVLIEMEFYRDGVRVLEFSTEQFEDSYFESGRNSSSSKKSTNR